MSADRAASGSPFPSFFIGGFESSTALLADGRRLDVVAASQHDRQLGSDYDLLASVGIRTVREAVRWPIVDRGGRLRLGEPRRMARLLRDRSMVPIWDLMHYGFPDGLDPFSAAFPDRFARYARATARVVTVELGVSGWYTPINEISFFTHAAADIGLFHPFARGRAPEFKRQLVRAAIAGMHAIREVDPGARFVHVDPLVHLVPQGTGAEEASRVDDFNEHVVFEAWQMLAGAVEPDLGGQPDFVTVAGLNLYRLCQWELGREGSFLTPEDPRWMPARDMLRDAWRILARPMIIGETGDLGPARARWLRYLLAEVKAAQADGVPIHGVCWYPAMSTPDWYDPTTIMPGGIWDSVPDGRRLRRVPYEPLLEVMAAETAGGPTDRVDAADEAKPAEEPPFDVHHVVPASASEGWTRVLLSRGDNLSVSVYTLAPGRAIGARTYPRSEVVLCVVEGSVTLAGWNRDQQLATGSVAVIETGRAFGLFNGTTQPAVVVQVTSPPAWSADLQASERRNRPSRGGDR